jgi:hypothetical protein
LKLLHFHDGVNVTLGLPSSAPPWITVPFTTLLEPDAPRPQHGCRHQDGGGNGKNCLKASPKTGISLKKITFGKNTEQEKTPRLTSCVLLLSRNFTRGTYLKITLNPKKIILLVVGLVVLFVAYIGLSLLSLPSVDTLKNRP